jgi:hypothetical protein
LRQRIGDAVVTAQAVQHEPNLVFGQEMPPRRPADLVHHLIRRFLGA